MTYNMLLLFVASLLFTLFMKDLSAEQIEKDMKKDTYPGDSLWTTIKYDLFSCYALLGQYAIYYGGGFIFMMVAFNADEAIINGSSVKNGHLIALAMFYWINIRAWCYKHITFK